MHIWPIFAEIIKMPGSFFGGNEVLEQAKDLVNITNHFKVIHIVAIFQAIAIQCASKTLQQIFKSKKVVFWSIFFKILHAISYAPNAENISISM